MHCRHLINVSYYTEDEEMQKWFHDKRYKIKQVAAERREQVNIAWDKGQWNQLGLKVNSF